MGDGCRESKFVIQESTGNPTQIVCAAQELSPADCHDVGLTVCAFLLIVRSFTLIQPSGKIKQQHLRDF